MNKFEEKNTHQPHVVNGLYAEIDYISDDITRQFSEMNKDNCRSSKHRAIIRAQVLEYF